MKKRRNTTWKYSEENGEGNGLWIWLSSKYIAHLKSKVIIKLYIQNKAFS